MPLEDRYYLHLLNCLPEFGPARLGRLAKYFPDFQTAYEASAAELFEAGIEPTIADAWFRKKSQLNIRQSLAELKNFGIRLLAYADESYPQLLRQIHSAPLLLYYRGNLENGEELNIGVVGTRKISAYGRVITPQIVAPLIQNGLTIVSGLAYGVDALAHKTALEIGGRTIAVLAGGLDDESIYPKHHLALAHDIMNNGGLLLSEYPPGRPALREHFVVRNRIIAGMSLGTLVIECAEKSGALLTASYALEQSRGVYAVPGPIYSPTSFGTNQLLKDGAKPVTTAEDILEDLNIQMSLKQSAPAGFTALTETEQTVLDAVSRNPVLADDLLASLPLEPSATASALTLLEIKGYIQRAGGQQYVRVK